MFHEVLVWHSPGLRRVGRCMKGWFSQKWNTWECMFTVRCVHPLSLGMTQRFSQALFWVIGFINHLYVLEIVFPNYSLGAEAFNHQQTPGCLDVCFSLILQADLVYRMLVKVHLVISVHQGPPPPPEFSHHITSSNLVIPFSVRSVVYQQNSKESATLQPFFTLQLDIQSEKIRTVQEALETLVARESVQGYTSKTKQEVWTKCTFRLFSDQCHRYYTV